MSTFKHLCPDDDRGHVQESFKKTDERYIYQGAEAVYLLHAAVVWGDSILFRRDILETNFQSG